ncbi:SCO2400 family protein, partial [Streptomyces pristinaespiralis]
MDYCSSCRRHLNGALVCPGCGAYAPDIAPPAHRAEVPAATAAATWEPYGAEEFPARPEAASTTGADGAAAATTSTGQGRAARRRQLARWKKNKRRAAAGTALAIVGGALTIAALPTDSGKGGASAAAAPDPMVPDEARKSRSVAYPTQP